MWVPSLKSFHVGTWQMLVCSAQSFKVSRNKAVLRGMLLWSG